MTWKYFTGHFPIPPKLENVIVCSYYETERWEDKAEPPNERASMNNLLGRPTLSLKFIVSKIYKETLGNKAIQIIETMYDSLFMR